MKLKFTYSMKKALKTFVLSSTWNKFLSGSFVIDFFIDLFFLYIYICPGCLPPIHPSICLSNSGSWGGLAPIPAVIGWKAG